MRQYWPHRLQIGPSRYQPAVDIARRRIPTDEIIGPCGRDERTANARRRRPDHLRIVTNVFPVPGRAVVGEDAGPEEALLGRPAADHRLEAESGVRAHPEVIVRIPAQWPNR